MPSAITPSAFSAPGKVLLVGGYLVLDKEYSGLVFALSARIHAVSSPAEGENTITVRSPQFSGAEWGYNVEFPAGTNGGGAVVTAVAGASKNPFVETAVRYVLSYLSASADFAAPLPSAVITIYADNDYYSQPASATPPPRFNVLNVPITAAHKTGLGSSAALTTSLTACLLHTYSIVAPSETQLHNLSQAAHCAAQGKVGSGFDVAAAVFGSCVYHRFSPSILEAVGDAGSGGFAGRLKAVVEKPWDLRVRKTQVPPGLRLLMGDVDCGSSTPGMVRSVLAWRKENPAAARAEWDAIQDLNRGLIDLLADAERRADVAPDEYLQALNELGDGRGVVSESSTLLQNIAEQIAAIRERIRDMGVAAGVPIEPEEQTKLLDSAVEATKGVLGGAVPGAGGYDAVVFLMADREDTVESLKKYLKGYEFKREDGGKGTVVALETREEHEGIKKEDASAY
ncbi:ribosomal protein S5 domain 2-type protein [Tricharina praecox]|uniref:ribosomal protein S5 domain 2-type protein n=1 Tax=Tricharina praecox TaxID=43433 RepID=UPI00221F9162|nr:ribosomal protein S5 domain 2-type protein [Tricharina praecox]KAI5855882.1 ribosomal protein S5 domain 2-type protein [Tricharina praecox]